MYCYLRHAQLDVNATPISQAAGGEGFCCRIAGHPHESLKIYQQPVPADLEGRLAYMMANPPATLGPHIAWPLDIVENGHGEVVGYLQQHFPPGYLPLTAIYSQPTQPRWATPTLLRRCACEVAYILAELHAHGYLFPDIHGDQFLVAKRRHTVLIDAASCQFTAAGQLYPCNRVREEFQGPELLGAANWGQVAAQRDPSTDCWSLAVLIFLLTLGCYPFDGMFIGSGAALPPLERAKRGFFPFERLGHDYRPPKHAPPYRQVDPDVRDLFYRTFVTGHARDNRHCRPTAAQWADMLRQCPQLRAASPAAQAFPTVGQPSSGRLATWLHSWLTGWDQSPIVARGSDWITPLVLAGLAGLGVGYQQWAPGHHARSDVPVYVHTSDFRPITTLKLRPDSIIPSVPSTPAAPSIDALLQRLRKPSHDHKETES